jgi:hypothetical protein
MALRRISATLGVLVLGLLATAGAASVSTSVSPKPPKAPAAAVNGPAPAAAAAAPIADVAQVAAPVFSANGGIAATAAPTTPDASALAAGPAADSISGLPQLRSLGQVAASVTDGPSTARELLTTPAGRSVTVLLGLILAVLLFLSVHRRLDRSDPKLAAVQSASDVARFR